MFRVFSATEGIYGYMLSRAYSLPVYNLSTLASLHNISTQHKNVECFYKILPNA